jgi:hypothetical protein
MPNFPSTPRQTADFGPWLLGFPASGTYLRSQNGTFWYDFTPKRYGHWSSPMPVPLQTISTGTNPEIPGKIRKNPETSPKVFISGFSGSVTYHLSPKPVQKSNPRPDRPKSNSEIKNPITHFYTGLHTFTHFAHSSPPKKLQVYAGLCSFIHFRPRPELRLGEGPGHSPLAIRRMVCFDGAICKMPS